VRVVHGHRCAFVRAGSGPPMLLLHGIGEVLLDFLATTTPAVHDSSDWRAMLSQGDGAGA
jgi:hypothetical protein